jgi:hypothetical protein
MLSDIYFSWLALGCASCMFITLYYFSCYKHKEKPSWEEMYEMLQIAGIFLASMLISHIALPYFLGGH